MKEKENNINIWGAREHNLKNIDVCIPRNSLTVITGLSGSGKSSLAFDTIYAEGQRRYIETFSAYARNFLDNTTRPNVDKITGLSPVISIDQKTTNRNPRSTVGTVTEIYDFLRLLYSRIGEAYSYNTGEKMVKYTEEKIIDMIVNDYENHKIYILAPIIRNRKGHYRELFESIMRKGYITVRVDGEITELSNRFKVDRYKNHTIEIVIDKLIVSKKDTTRLAKSVKDAFRHGEDMLTILDYSENTEKFYSKHLMCPTTGISYKDPSPHDFSFNSAQGACSRCKGLGTINVIDKNKVFPNEILSIKDGGISPLGKFKNSLIFLKIESLLKKYECTLDTPINELPTEAIDEIIDGTDTELHINNGTVTNGRDIFVNFNGLAAYIRQMGEREMTAAAQKWAEQFNKTCICPKCNGQKLNKESLHFFIDGKNIYDATSMDLNSLYNWINNLHNNLNETQIKIGSEIIKEILTRLKFLLDVGLNYLSLARSSISLSGGENQRIRLATQIGSQLVNVLYILDEPSIGLHQRDNIKLINSLKALRDIGNTVIVVEHDKDMMLNADYVVDIGPGAGKLGGELIYQGNDIKSSNTLTAKYLNGKTKIEIPKKRRTCNGNVLTIYGAQGNNLKNVTVKFPLGKLICVTGVSGSGKSSLITNTLLPILSQHFYNSNQEPLKYEKIEGLEYIDKVVSVDQSPIGRIPRSNPATYTGVFTDIRDLFTKLPEASIRGYKSGRFSFNMSGGRCEACKGNGYQMIEMNFLPNVMVPCEVCHGKRYNRETLEVKFKGKSIADVLDMTVDQAVDFFENVPKIYNKIKFLQDVGLGYIKLGQSSTTLSGGESQRVKLSTELSKKDTSKTLYILDEPTTGLHFEDIRILMNVIQRLVDRGNTVIIIEHNLDVIKMADYIIDMGPEGGNGGGMIIAEGTPEDIVKKGKGYTAQFLKDEIQVTEI